MSEGGANTMWGGRFAGGVDAIMQAINASIGFDKRLVSQDIAGSRAHAAMLAAQGIISAEDAKAIDFGLEQIAGEISVGAFPFRTEFEDIHMNVEARLRELIGAPAGRLHTARSRNDQVAVDFRLFVREQCDAAIEGIEALMRAFLAQAEAGADWVMPGFTHLQTAQPVTWGHHMLAYVEMLARDRSRFADARARMNECPLGAAALAGTSFPIDRDATAKALGFRPAHGEQPRFGFRSRLRARVPLGRLDLRHAPVALRRGAGDLVLGAVPLRDALRRLLDRLVDHAAEEEPGRRRTAARQAGPRDGGAGGAAGGDEGSAADLFQGHAGGQGTALRRRRHADAGAGRDGGHGARHDREPRCLARPRPRASPPRPTSPTGWCAPSTCRSATRTT
jgi:hypothetical protein